MRDFRFLPQGYLLRSLLQGAALASLGAIVSIATAVSIAGCAGAGGPGTGRDVDAGSNGRVSGGFVVGTPSGSRTSAESGPGGGSPSRFPSTPGGLDRVNWG